MSTTEDGLILVNEFEQRSQHQAFRHADRADSRRRTAGAQLRVRLKSTRDIGLAAGRRTSPLSSRTRLRCFTPRP